MAELIIIDTDVLIDAGRGDQAAVDGLDELANKTQLAVSAVTCMELILGCRNKADLRAVDRFLSHFTAIPLNTQISDTAIGLLKRYYLSHGLLMADALIAATAEWMQCSLLSKNWRDYRFIEGISLIEYPPPS